MIDRSMHQHYLVNDHSFISYLLELLLNLFRDLDLDLRLSEPIFSDLDLDLRLSAPLFCDLDLDLRLSEPEPESE